MIYPYIYIFYDVCIGPVAGERGNDKRKGAAD